MILTLDWKEPKVAIWYYLGSKDNFDYFLFRDLGAEKMYKVNSNDMKIENTFPLSKDNEQWRVMPWGPHAIKKE